ncbi:helix-turn-helix domain-containing protein [Algoriphagus algorifonticola]|uniref:helix-turn-helix domain-containing protein n=1 Tax=Algoriphagus algorifonticola TaxID=2593007 RepID=UPI0011A1190A|nr:helix-turn-helix transcriptional regulator [Algoriphagus algorifonticola]
MNYGTEIKSRRIAKGWSQGELAEKCQLTLRTIQRLEKGDVNPSLFTQSRILEVLDLEFRQEIEEEKFTNKSTSTKSKFMSTLFQLNPSKFIFISLATILLAWSAIWAIDIPELLSKKSILPDQIGLEIKTVNCETETSCDIEVTKKDKNGEILWQKIFGGNSYDKAAAILAAKDGGVYILGSTSSFGQGNYDILLIKTDSDGEFLWQKTYGTFFNDYAEKITYNQSGTQLEIQGKKQVCSTPNVSENCVMETWAFQVDFDGEMKS